MSKYELPPSSIAANPEKFMKDFEKVCKAVEEISRKLDLLVPEPKTCQNCYYSSELKHEMPCCDCEGYENWTRNND